MDGGGALLAGAKRMAAQCQTRRPEECPRTQGRRRVAVCIDAHRGNWHSSRMKTPHFSMMKIVLVPALALFANTASAQEKEDGKLTIEIPLAVQAAIKQEQGDGKVHDFQRVNEPDGTTYVVGLTIEGKNYKLALDAAGRVMSKELDEEGKEEKPLTIESLPAAIKKTLSRESNGAPILEVQIHAKTYTAEIKVGKRKYTIEIDEQGKLVQKRYTGDDDGN